jgi:hypothetical protein
MTGVNELAIFPQRSRRVEHVGFLWNGQALAGNMRQAVGTDKMSLCYDFRRKAL